ncbi:MAG: hypothetical protein AAGA55_02415, partial [Planctomycetota bacterium]
MFFTNTTAGVDVGIDPTTSSGKVIIGYKRAEGVINPVYQPPPKTRTEETGTTVASSAIRLVDDYGKRIYGAGSQELFIIGEDIVSINAKGVAVAYSGQLQHELRNPAIFLVDGAGAPLNVANGRTTPPNASLHLKDQPVTGQHQMVTTIATAKLREPEMARARGFRRVLTSTEWKPVGEVYKGEAYSVLAKIAGEAGGRGTAGQGAEVDAAGKISQWFATGKAADYLAKNEYAAAALTGSNDVAKAISRESVLPAGLIGDGSLDDLYRAMATLDDAVADLDAWASATPPDDLAAGHIAGLKKLSAELYAEIGEFQTVAEVGGAPRPIQFVWIDTSPGGTSFLLEPSGPFEVWSQLAQSEKYLGG